jgi:enoyl-CoA hydratase
VSAQTEAGPDVVVEQNDGVCVVRLNRPEARNALNGPVLAVLGETVERAQEDPDIAVIVLTGAGDKAFSAGMDLRGFAADGTGSSGTRADIDRFLRLLRGEFATPIIGAVNGSALAGGFELMLACDIVVAADHARFGLPEVKRGLIAGGTGVLLGARIPLAVALELTMTGEPIDAARAYELGLVNRVVPAAEVLPTALDLAGKVAANGPLAVRATRELVRLSQRDVAAAQKGLAEWQPVIFGSEDAREGAAAFVEKRAPVWRNR